MKYPCSTILPLTITPSGRASHVLANYDTIIVKRKV